MPPPRLRSIGPISDEARKLLPIWRGTEGSNPSPSSGESANYRFPEHEELRYRAFIPATSCSAPCSWSVQANISGRIAETSMTTSTATAYETVYPSLVKIRKPNGMGGRTNQHDSTRNSVLAVNEVACDRISLPRNPLGTEDRDQQL